MKFIKNVSINFIARMLTFLMGVPTSIIIARVLGPTDRGVYALVLLVPSMLLLLCDFGVGIANTYFIGRRKFKLANMASNSLLFGFLNGFFIAAVFLLFYEFVFHAFFVDIAPLFIYSIIVTVPFSLVSNYFSGILLAKFKIKELNLLLVFSSSFMLAGVVFLLLFLNKGVFSLILLSVLLSIILCSVYILLVNRLTRIKLSLKPRILKESLNFGIKGYFANIFSFLNYRLDMLFVNFFVGVTHVGYYSIAVGMAELLWFIPDSIQSILFSEVASRDSNSRQVEDMTAVLCRNILFSTLLLCAGLAIIGRELIHILFGSAYLPSFMPLLLLLPGVLMGSVAKPIAAYLTGNGKPIFAMYASSTSLIANVVLNILLIPPWGISGAAFATTITYTLEALMLFVPYLKMSQNGLTNSLIIKPTDLRLYSNLIKKATVRWRVS